MKMPLAEGFMTIAPGQWAVLVVGVAIIFSVQRWRRNVVRSRGKGGAGSGGEKLFPASQAGTGNPLNVREVTAEIQALLIDLEETSRRIAAQIDNRRVRIEQLMVEADEKIKRLETLTRASQSTTSTPATPPPLTMPTAVTRDAAQTLNRLRQERGALPAKEDPAYQPIYQLADQGKNAREIGQALNRQPGEIELILALRGRQRV